MLFSLFSRFAGSLLLWLAACAIFAASAAADVEQDFRAAKGPILQLLRSRQADNRIAGLRRLEQYPLVDAAKLLLQVGFKSQPPAVRRAAYESLLKFSDNEEIGDFLSGIIRRDARHKTLSDDSIPIVAALLASERPGLDRDSLELIDKSVGSPRRGLLTLTTLADELGLHGDQPDLRALEKLAKTKLFAAEFGFRRAVVQAIIRIHTPQAVEDLIALLADLKGEVRADVVDLLQKATGQAIEVDHAKWAAWWQENKAGFHYPAFPADIGTRSLSMATSSSYYGMPIYAQRLVFVLDTSGSMAGLRLAAAKRELLYAIARLDESASFSIIIFNSGVNVWQRQLARANAQTKHNAAAFVEAQGARGATASYDALEAAFTFDTESVFFLTDGEPHGGKIQNPAEIVAVITKANHPRRVSIYTIGIGAGLPGGPSDEFLHTLAEQNFGTYRRVDQ